MNLLLRVKNLWQLSRFKITEFDNKLVISKDEETGELIVAKPKLAQVIKRKTAAEKFLEDNEMHYG